MDDIIQEYIELVYHPQEPDSRLKDYMLTSTVLLRMDDGYWKIIYLENGNSLWIGWDWIDFFTGLYCYAGDRLINEENFVGLMMKLQSIIIKAEFNKGVEFLDILGDLCKEGTKGFIDKYPKLGLKPIELKQIGGVTEI